MASTRSSVVRFVRFAGLAAIFTLGFAVSQALAACGNGVIEAGEECDDGSQNGTTNSCCTVSCALSGKSPDVIVGDITTPTRYGNVGGITSYAIGTTSCNLGSCWLNWQSGTTEHPVIGENMYRLKDGRFEQIGQSWLKHGFTALQGTVCSSSCNAAPNGTHLGINCSDPYSSSLNGSQTSLGPKTDVNPNTGVFLYPDSRIGLTGNAIYKRLQVHDTDLNSASNPGALYFVEGQYVTHDDSVAKNNTNNASWRQTAVGVSPTYNISYIGSTQQQKAGIQAWKTNDPAVTESFVGANEGLFIMSAKATSLGGGLYHYEYAVQNLTNNRGAQSFTVPIPAGTTVTNVGFHDVDYHSGDPYDGTDWTPTVGSLSVSWTTTPFATNANANALRWGTLYNFRFDANVAPGASGVTIGLFKPGSPAAVTATTVVPGPCTNGANGLACDDHNACTLSDSCASGVCVGAAPVVCSPLDTCHDAGACNPGTGACSNPAKPDGTSCNDGSLCTQADTCTGGSCSSGTPVTCAPLDDCHQTGLCNPATGACSNPAKPDGSPCDDGTLCTSGDTCNSGSCAAGTPVVCSALDDCHDAGACNPGSGLCSNPEKAEGSPCNPGDLCVTGAACASGSCSGGSPVVCAALDDCHDAGACDSGTGACSNPARPDGTACDDANACTADDACASGVCTGNGPQVPQDLGPVVTLEQSNGVTTISWGAALASPAYSVLRGLVADLPVGPGGLDEQCLETGVAGTSTLDPEDPAPDTSFWYLVRGVNACGAGPYGYESVGGAPTTPRQSATCP